MDKVCKPKFNSVCPLCQKAIEAGQSMQPLGVLGWVHTRCKRQVVSADFYRRAAPMRADWVKSAIDWDW